MNLKPIPGGIYLTKGGHYIIFLEENRNCYFIARIVFNKVSSEEFIRKIREIDFLNPNYRSMEYIGKQHYDLSFYFSHGYCGKIKDELLINLLKEL